MLPRAARRTERSSRTALPAVRYFANSTALLSRAGRITQRNAESVEIVGLYWHFVDVVWIIIFTVVYLIK